MNLSTQRKLGKWLIAFAVIAWVVFMVVGIRRGHWHTNSVDFAPNGGSADISGSVDFGISEYYFIPIFLCGAVGIFFIVKSSRKPPKIRQ